MSIVYHLCPTLCVDDLLLVSLSVADLQQMLGECSEMASFLSLSFNTNKSYCDVLHGSYRTTSVTTILNGVIALYTLASTYYTD